MGVGVATEVDVAEFLSSVQIANLGMSVETDTAIFPTRLVVASQDLVDGYDRGRTIAGYNRGRTIAGGNATRTVSGITNDRTVEGRTYRRIV